MGSRKAALFLVPAMTLEKIKHWCARGATWLFGIGYYLIFFGCALALVDVLDGLDHAPAQANFLVAVFLVYVTWVLLVGIHELGHASAAWLSGWRVPAISIFSVTIWPSQLKIKYGLPVFPTNSGAIFAVPQRQDRLRGALIAIFLGGAGANFLFAIAAYFLARESQQALFWFRYLNVSATLSLMMGIANLFPIGQRRDGAIVLNIVRGEECESRIHVLQLFEEITKKKRPRDWDGELVEQVRRDFEAGRGFASAGLFLVVRHFDQNEIPAARAVLDEITRKVGDSDPYVNILRAFFVAYVDEDADGARKLLSTVKSNKLKADPDYWLAVTVTERAANDVAAEEFAAKKARIAYRRHPFSNEANFAFLDKLEASLTTGLQGVRAPASL